MEKEKKQKRSGYFYLRAKITKQEEEIAKLKNEIVTLTQSNANWCAICENQRTRINTLEEQLHLALKQMGLVRRLIYGY